MISKITERIRQNERWINLAYYLIYAALFFSALVGTTEFMQWTYVPHIRNMVYMGATGAMLLLWVLSLALQSGLRINAAKTLILAIGILQFIFGGGSSLILILTILIGATDRKSADIILKESLIIGLLVLCVTYLASMKGYITYSLSSDGRHTFGFIFYSHFSDKILYLYMIYRCIRHKRVSMVGYALTLVIVHLNYRYTYARTVTICLMLYSFLCAIYDDWRWKREGKKSGEMKRYGADYYAGYIDTKDVLKTSGTATSIKNKRNNSDGFRKRLTVFMAVLASGAYIWAAFLSIAGIWVYRLLTNYNRFIIPDFLQTFMNRLFFNSRALEEYGITAFGQKVFELTNMSNGNNAISNNFYLDNSYMRLFVITGAVTFVFFIVYMTILMWKTFKENRFYLFSALLVAAVGGLSETYTINFYYNVFLILAFSNLGDMGK